MSRHQKLGAPQPLASLVGSDTSGLRCRASLCRRWSQALAGLATSLFSPLRRAPVLCWCFRCGTCRAGARRWSSRARQLGQDESSSRHATRVTRVQLGIIRHPAAGSHIDIVISQVRKGRVLSKLSSLSAKLAARSRFGEISASGAWSADRESYLQRTKCNRRAHLMFKVALRLGSAGSFLRQRHIPLAWRGFVATSSTSQEKRRVTTASHGFCEVSNFDMESFQALHHAVRVKPVYLQCRMSIYQILPEDVNSVPCRLLDAKILCEVLAARGWTDIGCVKRKCR